MVLGDSDVPVSSLPDGELGGLEAGRTRQWREIGLGALILRDLGGSSIRLLSLHERFCVGPRWSLTRCDGCLWVHEGDAHRTGMAGTRPAMTQRTTARHPIRKYFDGFSPSAR
jgi:hypothetical protein